jgi:hypothetical protein
MGIQGNLCKMANRPGEVLGKLELEMGSMGVNVSIKWVMEMIYKSGRRTYK